MGGVSQRCRRSKLTEVECHAVDVSHSMQVAGAATDLWSHTTAICQHQSVTTTATDMSHTMYLTYPWEGRGPSQGLECAAVQSLSMTWPAEVLSRWEVGGLGPHSIWSDRCAQLPLCFGDCPQNMFVLWVRQAPPPQELPSPCQQLFCSHAF